MNTGYVLCKKTDQPDKIVLQQELPCDIIVTLKTDAPLPLKKEEIYKVGHERL